MPTWINPEHPEKGGGHRPAPRPFPGRKDGSATAFPAKDGYPAARVSRHNIATTLSSSFAAPAASPSGT